MKILEKPARKFQKKKDYNKFKLLRKIKRKRKAQIEKLTKPKYDEGTDDNSETYKIGNKPLLVNPTTGNVKTEGNPEGGILLDEVIITPPKKYEYSSAFNGYQEYLNDIAGFVPYLGNAIDAYDVYHDFKNKEYSSATANALWLLLPSAAKKSLKYLGKSAMKYLKPGIRNIINDVSSDWRRVIRDYKNGDYPITYKQRREFIEKRNKIYQDIMDQLDEYEKQQLQKRAERSLFLNNVAPFKERPKISTSRRTVENLNTADNMADYNTKTRIIRIPNRFDKNSNFNDYNTSYMRGVFGHEYAHHLQNTRPGLNLSITDPKQYDIFGNEIGNHTGYYIIDRNNKIGIKSDEYNPFTSFEDALNVYRHESSNGIQNTIDIHSLSPNEVVADRFGRLIGGDFYKTIDEIKNKYGISKEDLDMMEQIGFNSGKDPGIHIKKNKRGSFTKAAKAHNMNVQEFAHKVLNAPKGKYSSIMRKKANFARNASKWN